MFHFNMVIGGFHSFIMDSYSARCCEVPRGAARCPEVPGEREGGAGARGEAPGARGEARRP